jgi:U3 small nucleolar RNA-associated protein 14
MAKTIVRKSRPSSSKANAAGYARRHSRKAENPKSLSDVYEYQPGKVGRLKVGLELSRDEAAEFGHDGSDGEGEGRELVARLVGENETLDSEDDDEEVESDDAFEESDE